MSETHEELTAMARAASPDANNASVPDLQSRGDLAFPRLSEEMLQRIVSYGHEETVAENTQLYTYGDRGEGSVVISNIHRYLARTHLPVLDQAKADL